MLRREAFAFLSQALEDIKACKELSSVEIDMIVKLTDDSFWSNKFWLTVELCKTLCDWGVAVSVRLHQCPCHPNEPEEQDSDDKKKRKLCKLKGRQGCAMAWGLWKDFVRELDLLQPSRDSLKLAHVMQVEGQMNADSEASGLLQDFQACKAGMLFRARQAWSFWEQLPWSVLKLAGFLWGVRTEDDCRKAARMLVQEFEHAESKSSLGAVAMRFLSPVGEFWPDVNAWISGQHLADRTRQQLLLYSSCLIVMQRLEAKLHYLRMQVSRGRASSAPATIAELRRGASPDLCSRTFREALPRFLKSFDELLPDRWHSMGDLLHAVYGHGLQQMHPDIGAEYHTMQHHLQALSECKLTDPAPLPPLLRDHVNVCFKKDKVYALPAGAVRNTEQTCDFKVFRVVSLNPSGRMYIQRASALSYDAARLTKFYSRAVCFLHFRAVRLLALSSCAFASCISCIRTGKAPLPFPTWGLSGQIAQSPDGLWVPCGHLPTRWSPWLSNRCL